MINLDESLNTDDAEKLLSNELWIFDGDGVLYQEGEVLSGAKELLVLLRELGKKIALVTNNSTKTVEQYEHKLQEMGMEIEKEAIFTSAYVAVEAVMPIKTAYVLGTEGIRDACRKAGIEIVNEREDALGHEADVVFVGMDTELTYKRLAGAALAISKGALFVATNPDKSFPTPMGQTPGAGAIMAAVETTVGRPANLIAGKPEPLIFEKTLQAMNCEASQAIMVGDRYETDILGGKCMEIDTLLMRTGIGTGYAMDEIESWHTMHGAPTYVSSSLQRIVELLEG